MRSSGGTTCPPSCQSKLDGDDEATKEQRKRARALQRRLDEQTTALAALVFLVVAHAVERVVVPRVPRVLLGAVRAGVAMVHEEGHFVSLGLAVEVGDLGDVRAIQLRPSVEPPNPEHAAAGQARTEVLFSRCHVPPERLQPNDAIVYRGELLRATLRVEQGDVLGPLLFAVGFRRPVERLRAALVAALVDEEGFEHGEAEAAVVLGVDDGSSAAKAVDAAEAQ